MQIQVELMGSIRRPEATHGQRQFTVEIQPETSISEFLSELGYSRQDQRYIIVFVDQQQVSHNYSLQPGDSVFITLPVGGGTT